MPLEKRTVNFPFAVDLETKTDPKQVDLGEVTVIENARTDQNKQIRQRPGYLSLTTSFFGGSYPTNGVRALSRRDEISIDNGASINSYSEASGSRSTTWRFQKYTGPWLKLNTKDYGSSILGVTAFASNSNVECVYSQGLFQVYEKTNKTLLFSSAISTGQYNIHDLGIACFTDTVWVVYSEVSSGNIKAIAFDLTTFNTTIAATTLFASGGSYIRLKTIRDSHLVVCENTTYKVYAKTSTTAVGTAALPFAAVDVDALLGAALANDRIFVCFWNAGNTPNFRQYDYLGTNTIITTALSGLAYTNTERFLVCGAVASNEMKFVVSQASGTLVSPRNPLEVSYDISGSVVSSSAGLIAALTGHPYSKPFSYNGRVYIFMRQDASYFVSLIASNKVVVTKIGEPYITPPTSPAVFVYSNYFEFAFSNRSPTNWVSIGAITDNPDVTYVRYRFDDDSTKFGPSFEYGSSNFSPKNGCIQYDGASYRHVGFVSKPRIIKITSAAGSIAAGTYRYVAVFMHKDNEGRLHRSQVSDPISITTGISSNISFEVVNPGFDNYLNGSISVIIYRTTSGGSVFSQVGSYIWDEIAASTAYTDSQASIDASAQIVYTTSGELDAVACPAISSMTVHQNRFFGISSENTNRLLYTKEVDVHTAPEWNEDLFLDVNDGYGGLIGAASMDEKLVCFKQREIFYFVGDGPSPSGDNSNYSAPIRITSDIGLSEENALCVFPLGILFKSLRGWLLLDRNLSIVQLGDPVRRFNGTTCLKVVVNKPDQYIHCFLADGTVLLFNYNQMTWSVDTNVNTRNATLWDQKLTFLDSNDGIVKYFTTSKILDGSSYTPMKITTPWIPVAGAQSYQRIYEAILFGEFRANHTITIKIGYNYDPVFREQKSIAATSTIFGSAITDNSYYSSSYSAGGEPAKIYQLKFKPYIQKCEAIRFEISISNPSLIDSELCRLSGLALTFGVKSKTNRLNASRVIT